MVFATMDPQTTQNTIVFSGVVKMRLIWKRTESFAGNVVGEYTQYNMLI